VELVTDPLVCCICPTFNRREFIPRAIRCFLAQDYPNRQLIILDDGTDLIQDLVPADPSIVYLTNPTKECYGVKLNRLCESASSEYVMHWDDDDWHSPSRISRQMCPLIEDPNLKVSGTSQIYYYRHDRSRQAWLYKGNKAKWLGGIGYPLSAWRERKFDTNSAAGADTRWLVKIPVEQRYDVADPALFIATVHARNDCPKNVNGPDWKLAKPEWSLPPWSQVIEKI